jgi:hypothetical protein
MTALIGFTPDLEPDVEGGMTSCLDVIPSDRGMKGAPSAVATAMPALASACRGIASVFRLDGTYRTVAGTSTALYDTTGSPAWVDRSPAPYALGSEDRWAFTQFGNITLAATPSITIQQSNTGNFASIASTVKAEHITTVSGFVMVANYNNGTSIPDGWKCSAYQDYADWVDNVSTQAASGRLLDTAGEITALRRIGDYAVAYKERAIYLGVYVGAPAVWNFQRILGEVGCLGTGLIVSNEQYHLFFGNDDVYRFDGANLTPLQAPCSRYVINTINKSAIYLCQSAWDNDRGLAWWFYPTSGSTQANAWVAFHPETGRWGYGELTIEAIVQFINGAITYETAPTEWTYDVAPTYSYDSAFWSAITVNLSVVKTDHTVYNFNGNSTSSSFTLSEIGSDMGDSLISRFWPRFYDQPTTATMTITAKYDADSAYVPVTSTAINKGRFDFLSTALWHTLKIDLTGDWEASSYEITVQSDGVN